MKSNRVIELREILEEDIITGRIALGSKLDEAGIAARFGVSRTPVREAFNQLAAEGHLELRPNKGAYVAPLNLKKLFEMFEVMAEMEAVSGKLAARRMKQEELDDMQAALEACRKAAEDGDADTYYEKNALFHETIYNGCHNVFLANELRQIRRRLQLYRRLQLRVRNRIRHSLDEHIQIAQAIVDGKEDEAEKLIYQHVAIQGERFAQLLSEIQSA